MSVFLAAQEKMEMYFNGPMRSGIVLDSQGLLNRGYRSFQKELAEKLRHLYVGRWDYPSFQGRKNKLAFDVDSFQGETIIPRYLISRVFEGQELEDILSEFRLQADIYPAEMEDEDAGAPQPDEMIAEPAAEPAPEVTNDKRLRARPEKKRATAIFRIEKLDVFLYDYGYASCIISGHVTAQKDLTIQEYRSAVEHISSSLPDYTELFQSTIGKVAKVIPPEFIIVSFHENQPETGGFWPNTTLKKNIGELFWVHRIFSVPCKDQVDFIRKKTECRALVYSARSDDMADVSLRADMAVFPGHGNSCVVYTREATPEWNAARLRSTVRAMNVFYAAMEDLDRDLFYLNNETGAKGHSSDMDFMEQQAQYMADGLTRVNFVKSIYEDYDNQLDPQSIEIWNTLRRVWIMDDMFRAIDQKVTMLDKAHARTVQRIATLQSKKIGALIIIFILVALFAVIFGLLGVFSGGHTGGIGIPEAILLALAVIGATLLAMRLYKGK